MELIRGYTAAFLFESEEQRICFRSIEMGSLPTCTLPLKKLLLGYFLLPAETVCLETEFTVVIVPRVSLKRLKFFSC